MTLYRARMLPPVQGDPPGTIVTVQITDETGVVGRYPIGIGSFIALVEEGASRAAWILRNRRFLDRGD